MRWCDAQKEAGGGPADLTCAICAQTCVSLRSKAQHERRCRERREDGKNPSVHAIHRTERAASPEEMKLIEEIRTGDGKGKLEDEDFAGQSLPPIVEILRPRL